MAESLFKNQRQAVVIIHGIGEQRPMTTLRSFVDTLLLRKHRGKSTTTSEPTFYSKPDRISESYELRRLTTVHSRPRTDFYEFYWAHLMPVASWFRVLEWLRLLLFRPPSEVPSKLQLIWALSWLLLLVIVALVGATLLSLLSSITDFPLLKNNSVVLPISLAIPVAMVEYLVLSYLGDAAIYLSSNPRNVDARQTIRQAGVQLVEKLHSSGEYDRIVIVGHSLGSVIGYDIITFAWQLYHEQHNKIDTPNHEILERAERSAASLTQNGATSVANFLSWRRLTRELWKEQRAGGFPWLISDFITLGSPLTYAGFLLAESRNDLIRRKQERELPTCPPNLENGKTFSYPIHYVTNSHEKRTTYALHHAACFAVTAWTNIYFPSKAFLFGDIIGGPVSPSFGPGVRDRKVSTFVRTGWLAHTSYWGRGNKSTRIKVAERALALAIDLKQSRL